MATKSQNRPDDADTQKLEALANKVIGVAIKVHKLLGPGFVERIYAKALAYELQKSDIKYSKEIEIKINYEGAFLGGQRVDFIIEDSLLLELKNVSEINKSHIAQTLSYLKAASLKLGLILNYADTVLKIKRVIN